MRSDENTPPESVVRYVAKLDNHELAMHIKAYKISAGLYGLPPYLVALLHEAIHRIKDKGYEQG